MNTKYKILIILAIISILGLIGFLIWWLKFRHIKCNFNEDDFEDPFTWPLFNGSLKLDNTFIQNPIINHELRPNTGLSKDLDVYMSVLRLPKYGHYSDHHFIQQDGKFLVLEHIPPKLSNHEGKIIFIPNQELLDKPDEKLLLQPGCVDRVLCKSVYAREIFEKFKKNEGCTWTVDSFIFPPVLTNRFFNQEKDRSVYFHPAGGSWMKHTNTVIEAWISNPHWPPLVVTCRDKCNSTHRESLLKIKNIPNIIFFELLPASAMRLFQMHSGVVIMPSACEGFGHSIYETMENGNLLITTDIPPMNENLIDGTNSLLIPSISSEAIGDPQGKFNWSYDRSIRAGNSGSYCVDISVSGIEKAVERSLNLSNDEYDKIRLNAVKKVHQLATYGWGSLTHALERADFVVKKGEEETYESHTDMDTSLNANSRLIYYLGSISKLSHKSLIHYFNIKPRGHQGKYMDVDELDKATIPGIPRTLMDEVSKLLRKNKWQSPVRISVGDCAPTSKESSNPTELVKNRYNTTNGVILPLKWDRHWGEVDKIDSRDIPWSEKHDICVWRGTNTGKVTYIGGNRFVLCERWASSSDVDVGFSSILKGNIPPEQIKKKMDIKEMLRYKYIISAPGNDKDSGLQWKMASKSVVLMPRPLTHTWFMESELEPYVHYIPLDDDYENLLEQLDWCKNNQDKCINITKSANKWVKILGDPVNNKHISRAVINAYSRIINSLSM